MSAVMPAPQVMNAMDPETKLVHAMLEAWGRWAKDMECQGWPAKTLLGRMIDYGPQGASEQGRPPIAMPDEIAITDAAVARLGEVDRTVIRVYYLEWAPADTLWRRCKGIRSLSNFRAVLKRARWRVAAYVDRSVDDNFKRV